ncbi:MAG TPA: ABC transporter permease [Vicinamibacterales bacterium]|nr:ABC transporter permease [Vicinamibacterales bacterium]
MPDHERTDWKHLLAPRLNSGALRFSPAREAEIIEELSQHLDDRVEELVREGVSRADAERTAVTELTDEQLVPRLNQLRQAHVAEPPVPGRQKRRLLADLWQDIRYGWRALASQPAFTAAAVLTLTLGIGANTAVFSLVNALLLRPLPYSDPAGLAWIANGQRGGAVFSYPEMADLRDHNDVFAGVAAWGPITASVNADNNADQIPGFIVSGNYFDLLGVRAATGRLLAPSDDVTPGAHPVMVVSHRFWQERFAGNENVVGRDILLNGQRFTIVGVVERGFRTPDGSRRDLFVPMMMQSVARPPRAGYAGEMNPDLLNVRTNTWVFAIGRLKTGVPFDRAQTALSATMTSIDRARQATSQPHVITLFALTDGAPGQRAQIVPVATLLFWTVAAVLLIASVNVANLLLSRAATRRREIALRLALGASRWRLVRQFLTESVLLATLSGIGGVALAWVIAAGFRAAPPPPGALPVGLEFEIDYRVLGFTLALSIVTGIAFGLVPALATSRPNLVPSLKDAEVQLSRRHRFNLRQILVVTEVALSLILVVASGLFVRSLRETQAIEPGFDANRLVVAPLNINLLRYTTAQGKDFYQRVVERVESIAGVEAAAVARVQVFGPSRVASVRIEGQTGPADVFQSSGTGIAPANRNAVNTNVVGPGYFKVLGLRFVEGRDFSTSDAAGAPSVVIVNQAFAAGHLPGEAVLNRRISFRGDAGPWHTIVGVVSNSKYASLAEPFAPIAYVPLAQNHETGVTLHVRARVAPDAVIPAVRNEIRSIEPNLPVPDVRTMDDTIGASLYAARMGAWSIGVLGGLALLLAAIGVYGVLAFSVARRTRELGIRVALGADRGTLMRLVLREGLILAAIGITIGLAGAVYVVKPLARFLYGVQSHDVATFIAAPAVLLLIAAVACLLPARKAMRVQPTIALRS